MDVYYVQYFDKELGEDSMYDYIALNAPGTDIWLDADVIFGKETIEVINYTPVFWDSVNNGETLLVKIGVL